MQGTTPSQAEGWEEDSLRPHVWEALREAASAILRMPKKLTDSVETPVEIRRCFKLSAPHILLDGCNGNCSGIW